MRYTYLVATLPMLPWGGRPPFSTDEFRRQCAGILSVEDEAELSAILEGRPEEGISAFAQAWNAVDTQVRNSIVRWRAGRRRIDGTPFLKEETALSGYVERAVAEALAKDNPLEREQLLDQCRWFWAGELAQDDPFGLAPVLAFGVKLALLERWHQMDAKKGAERVQRFVTDQLVNRGMATEFDVEAY